MSGVANRSVPDADVIPVLSVPDVAAAAGFLVQAFGFRVRLRIGGHRVQLVRGRGAVILTDAGWDPARPPAGHAIHVRVEDVDAHHARAVAAGARVAGPPETFPFGERQYSAVDPFGHSWTFSESVGDVDPATWGGELVEGA